MRHNRQIMMRETGAAFAVLAIYVLTLLLPLHLSAGMQRDFNALGYSTLASWSVCAPLAQDESGAPVEASALKCPATGVAKYQMAAVLPPVPTLHPPTIADFIRFADETAPHAPGLPRHVGQSRAPPVAV